MAKTHLQKMRIILKYYPSIQHVRKMTMEEWVAKRAFMGEERAVKCLKELEA